jgi:cytochrome P450
MINSGHVRPDLHRRRRIGSSPSRRRPVLDIDLCSRKALMRPHETYRAIRDAGPVVWLPRHRLWAMGRYADVQASLRNDALYRSGEGVLFNPLLNRPLRKTTLASDGDVHTRRRKVLLQSLGAKALAGIGPDLQEAARAAIDDLLWRESFDGVRDFASRLPLSVVGELVGVSVNQDRLLRWGRRSFDSQGPLTNRRVLAAFPTAMTVWLYTALLNPSRVAPGSWAAAVLTAGQRGELTRSEAKYMVLDLVVPSLDTTILAAAQLLWCLGENSEAWRRLRCEPELVPAAVAEAVRLASPVRGFGRTVSCDTAIGEVHLSAGDRVAVLFASANGDEAQFPDPGRFDLDRRGANLGWGYGAHACVGMHLSRLEMQALLNAMIPRVDGIEVWRPQRLLNNGLQGLRSFRASFRPDGR